MNLDTQDLIRQLDNDISNLSIAYYAKFNVKADILITLSHETFRQIVIQLRGELAFERLNINMDDPSKNNYMGHRYVMANIPEPYILSVMGDPTRE